MKIDIVLDVKPTLGEGPLWDVQQQRLYFIDSLDGRVFRCTADGRELQAWELGSTIGSMALRKDGDHALVSLKHGIHDLDLQTGELTLVAAIETELPHNRLNDGKVDRQGRFVVGSMDTSEQAPSGSLYRLDPDLSLHVLDTGIVCSNGPCWSPDGRTFYFCDTWAGEIWAYDYQLADGSVSNRRALAPVDGSGGGAADGCTVDEQGFLWQALVYAGKLVRYAPDGSIDRTIDMPVKKVTSCMFGGPDLDVLYVTSMAKPPLPRFPADPQPRGALFAISGLGVRGIPEARFAS